MPVQEEVEAARKSAEELQEQLEAGKQAAADAASRAAEAHAVELQKMLVERTKLEVRGVQCQRSCVGAALRPPCCAGCGRATLHTAAKSCRAATPPSALRLQTSHQEAMSSLQAEVAAAQQAQAATQEQLAAGGAELEGCRSQLQDLQATIAHLEAQLSECCGVLWCAVLCRACGPSGAAVVACAAAKPC
jgi:DNA repair exonuclease SbcCD ATPase subunit